MKNLKISLLGIIFLSSAALFLSKTVQTTPKSQNSPALTTPTSPTTLPTAQNVKIIDGDTIEINGERIRYIGIDTPEYSQCLGDKATEKNRQLLENEEVKLEYDIEKKDKYERTLAYVWVGEFLINERLLEKGLATVTTYPPNVKYVDRFLEAQDKARDKKLGLWALGVCSSPTSQTSPISPTDTNCQIKGNTSSSSEKIYHVPGQRYWEKTKIEGEKGERWFCSEEEAQNAGWRKSKV